LCLRRHDRPRPRHSLWPTQGCCQIL